MFSDFSVNAGFFMPHEEFMEYFENYWKVTLGVLRRSFGAPNYNIKSFLKFLDE